MEAWELANQAARAAGVELRPLTTIEDADRILAVMIATWGEHQLLPREMIRALSDSGNTPWGAFDGEGMIGYVLGWSGVDPDEGLHAHSHMLATLPDRRHRGVGYALKLAQRAQCLEQGDRGGPLDVRSAPVAQRVLQPDASSVPSRIGSCPTSMER